MIRLQRTGYRSGNLGSDIYLGLTDGLDSALWCYVCASIIFIGPLSVYLPVGILSALSGWVLLSLVVSLTSREPLHIATLDDQGIVIFGSVSAVMIAAMGDEAASPRGLATLLTIIALTSLGFGFACHLVGRYKLARVLELLPFPVVCGFMASIGWLVIGAGLEVASDVSMSRSVLSELDEGNRGLRLGLAAGLGGVMLWATSRFEQSWTLPAVSAAIVAGYYGVMLITGYSHAEQLSGGWLFQVGDAEGGVAGILATLSPRDIDWEFVVRVMPQILTIIFLAMLTTSLSLSALKAEGDTRLQVGEEFNNISVGNVLCAGVGCPPGYTDVVATSMFRQFRASSRWMPLTATFTVIFIAAFGGWIIGYLPRLVMAATIFLFAYQMLYEWLFANVRGFNRLDYLIIWVILGTTIAAGFMQGIAVGILLALLLFVIRYSRVTAIHARGTLSDERSSVERSLLSSKVLQRHGSSVIIYSLRGYLFFGTANSIIDRITTQEKFHEGRCKAILIDMHRVTGVDVSALNAFAQLRRQCEAGGVRLHYSGVPEEILPQLFAVEAVSFADDGTPLVFDSHDFALEYLENDILEQRAEGPRKRTIREFLVSMIGAEEKADILLRALRRTSCEAGAVLFRQGDADTGMFILEEGSLSAYIQGAAGEQIRVKKFRPGSVLGELSAYLALQHRTATVVADEDSVIYHLDRENLERLESANLELRACIHELVAKVLAERVSAMNDRMAFETS
jgi:SulP family sulfate permease